VMVQGTTQGTVTDGEGLFELQVAQGAMLWVSYSGYESQTVHAEPNMYVVLNKKTYENHRFALWAGMGICSPLEAYNTPGMFGKYSYAGGSFGLGYQFRHNLFLLETGLQMTSINYTADYKTLSLPADVMVYTLRFEVPVLVGMEMEYWYWLAGLHLGVFDDNHLKVFNHNTNGRDNLTIAQMNFAYAPAAEIGMNLNRSEANYKLALYAQVEMDKRELVNKNLYNQSGWWMQTLMGIKFTVAF